MATIPAFEAKTKFGELLDRVMGGEEIGAKSLEGIRRAAKGLEALQKEIAAFGAGQRAVSWKGFKSLVEEGRR
jgi:hypothetical protein